MSRRLVIPDTLRRMQATASDPSASAWVSANAGSGKTHVLTQRVLRLLLTGAPPAQILGLTFTKAAAANMARRIFNTLAEWASLGDEALTAAIVESGAEKPGPHDLVFARQLFARTIETPGGSRIQTLHAFCERLLQLFPFEANVPAHFKVIDEREAKALMDEARDGAIASARSSLSESAGTRGARSRRLQIPRAPCGRRRASPRPLRPSTTPRASRRRCEAGSASRPGRRPRASRPRCSAATSDEGGARPGRRGSTPARTRIGSSRRSCAQSTTMATLKRESRRCSTRSSPRRASRAAHKGRL